MKTLKDLSKTAISAVVKTISENKISSTIIAGMAVIGGSIIITKNKKYSKLTSTTIEELKKINFEISSINEKLEKNGGKDENPLSDSEKKGEVVEGETVINVCE